MIAKILCPEREVSKVATVQCPPGECTNVIEAAAQGAADCIPLVLNIGGIMLAFISLLALLDAVLGYFGTFVGLDDLSFNLICGYAFRPFAFIIGVPWSDCHIIAELLGKRLFINEVRKQPLNAPPPPPPRPPPPGAGQPCPAPAFCSRMAPRMCTTSVFWTHFSASGTDLMLIPVGWLAGSSWRIRPWGST